MEPDCYLPKSEHPFDLAAIDGGRLLCRLALYETPDGYNECLFLEIDITGRMKRVIVVFDLYSSSQYHRVPELGEYFPIYGIHAAGQLFKKYYAHLLACQF